MSFIHKETKIEPLVQEWYKITVDFTNGKEIEFYFKETIELTPYSPFDKTNVVTSTSSTY